MASTRPAAIAIRSVLLLCVQAVFLWYEVFGVPELVARLTLLSNTTTNRMPLAIGFIEMVLAARTLTLAHDAPSWERAQLLTVAACALAVGAFGSWFTARELVPELATSRRLSALLILSVAGSVAVPFALLCVGLGPSLGSGRSVALSRVRLQAACGVALVATALLPGIVVNPVQQGLSPLTESEAYTALQAYAAEEPEAVWLTGDPQWGQACVSAGLRTMNCVNVYPDVERWKVIDPDGMYEEVWNRYAHITANMVEGAGTTFTLTRSDKFTVDLTVEDLRALGVDYILTSQDLSAFSSADVTFVRVDAIGSGQWIWRIDWR